MQMPQNPSNDKSAAKQQLNAKPLFTESIAVASTPNPVTNQTPKLKTYSNIVACKKTYIHIFH